MCPAESASPTVAPLAVHLRSAAHMVGMTAAKPDHCYSRPGWITDRDGHTVMAAPAGSVCAAGIRHDVDVEVAGKDPTLASIGWVQVSHTDAERRAGIEALMALVGLVPTRPEHGVDVLGALFSAPLRLSRRAGHLYIGKTGSGKSLCASAAFAAMSGIGMDGASFPIKLAGSSKAGVRAQAAWHADMVCFADRYRHRTRRGASQENKVATDALGVLLNGSYDSVPDSSLHGIKTGRALAPVETTAYVTGETTPEDDATLIEHAIMVRVFKGEVDLNGGGAIDRYRKLHASGNSRRGLADYLQWLARQVDDGGDLTGGGGLTGLRAWADEAKRVHAARLGSGRAGEAVATDATGWQAYRMYAREHGRAELLPAQGELDDWLELLVESTSIAHACVSF